MSCVFLSRDFFPKRQAGSGGQGWQHGRLRTDLLPRKGSAVRKKGSRGLRKEGKKRAAASFFSKQP